MIMSSESLYDLNKKLQYYKIDKGMNTLVLYHGGDYLEPYEWMIPFGLFMQENGFYVVFVLCYEKNLETDIPIYRLEQEEIKHIKYLDLLIQVDLFATEYPVSTKVIAVFHAGDLSRISNFLNQIHEQLFYDAVVANIPLKNSYIPTKQLWENFFDSKYYKRKSEHFCIFSCGYLRSYVISKKIKELSIEPHAICYAPAARNWANNNGGDRIKLYAEKLLRILLGNFSGYKIIFRPALSYSKMDDELFKIIDKFKKFEKFYFDADHDRFQCFSQSSILITDLSHIGKTFSLTTYRPALYFQPWKKNKLPRISLNEAYCFSFSQLIKCLKMFLSNEGLNQELIRRSISESTLPSETAFDELLFFSRKLIKDDFFDLDINKCIVINRNNCTNYNSLLSVKNWIDSTGMLPGEFFVKYFDSPIVLLASILSNVYHGFSDTISQTTKDMLVQFYPETKNFQTYMDARDFCILKIKQFLIYFIKEKNILGVYVCQAILELESS